MMQMNYFRVTLPLNISLMHTFVQVKAFLDFSEVLWRQFSHQFIFELWVKLGFEFLLLRNANLCQHDGCLAGCHGVDGC